MSKLYQKYLDVLLRKVQKSSVSDQEIKLQINSLNIVTLVTSLLMLVYIFTCFQSTQIFYPTILLLICFVLHVISPFIIWIGYSIQSATQVMLISCLIFQMIYTFYSGGIRSLDPSWKSMLPFFAGMILGRKSLIRWVGLILFIEGGFIAIDMLGINLPQYFNLQLYAKFKIVFFLSWVFTMGYIGLTFVKVREDFYAEFEKQLRKQQTLVKVLGLDILNSCENYARNITKILTQTTSIETEKKILSLQEQNNRIRQMIQQSLQLSLLKEGYVFERKLVLPIELIENLISVFENQLQTKNIQVIVKNNLMKDILVYVNENIFLLQVLANIFSNAIKFSFPQSEIEIHIEQIDNKVKFSIIDYGLGMPQEMIERLFSIETNISRKGTKGETGTGFGMLLAKLYTEKMNGTINVESSINQKSKAKTVVEILLPSLEGI